MQSIKHRPGIRQLAARAHSSLKWLACAAAALCLLSLANQVSAAPAARILRIDPRAAQESGNPILTTVIEVSQAKRVSDQIRGCAGLRGNAQYGCMSEALEKPYALYTPFPFPQQNAIFTVNIEGADYPAKYVSHSKWGESLQKPGVGTAWLILIDADRRMGSSFDDAKQVAEKFIQSMGPNDIVDVMFFNDRQVVQDSKWLATSQKSKALSVLGSVSSTYTSSGRNRSLLTIIKNAATDGFKALGNVGENIKVPLHQAMVVLSTGYGGADPSTTGPGALQLQKYLTGGRFPEDNTALPKAPVPVISVYFPPKTFDEFKQNSIEFMQGMVDTEIGGFFSVMQSGEGNRAQSIVNAVRTRFSKMYIVKWRVSCLAPSVTQSFKLVFNNVKPPILGDNSFKDVPIGIDPTAWPLDVNLQYTQDIVNRGDGVYPGGAFKVYGNFCWGGDKERAEVYFIPAGQQLPADLQGTDIDQAKRTQQRLIAMGMKGTALEANDSYVELEAPDKDKILHGSGSQAVVRLVLFDNKAKRTSGVTADSIVQLKGSKAPLPLLPILGGLLALVVILLLVIIIVRSGSKRRGSATPAPAYAGGYGAPGGYGGAGYGGGGYGAPPAAAGGYGAPPAPGGYGPPPGAAPGGAAPQHAAPQHAAPQAGAQPGAPQPVAVSAQSNQEFMYGAAGQGASPGVAAAQPPAPAPPNPYGGPVPGQGPAPESVTRATLQGAAGVFTIVPGVEMRAGRDGSQCGILLSEPRVSGVHATVKLDSGQLFVRDENSNNGTLVNGNKLQPGVWSPVQHGSILRFGPVEFSARLE